MPRGRSIIILRIVANDLPTYLVFLKIEMVFWSGTGVYCNYVLSIIGYFVKFVLSSY